MQNILYTKFRVLLKIVGGIILINLIGCDSLKKTLAVDNINSMVSSEPISVSNISSDLIVLPKKTKSQLKSHILSSSKKTLAAYYNESYIDSLRSVLTETGSLKINVFESFLIDYIKSNSLSDTTYLANLYLNSPVKAENISFSYDVKKDDILFYEIKNTKSNTLKKIEITEGKTVRFLKNNLKKKETVKGLAGLGDLYVSSGGGRNSLMGSYIGQGMTFTEAKKNKMSKVTVEGADLAIEIGKKVNEDFDKKKLPLMLGMINAIIEDKKLELDWQYFN